MDFSLSLTTGIPILGFRIGWDGLEVGLRSGVDSPVCGCWSPIPIPSCVGPSVSAIPHVTIWPRGDSSLAGWTSIPRAIHRNMALSFTRFVSYFGTDSHGVTLFGRDSDLCVVSRIRVIVETQGAGFQDEIARVSSGKSG